MVSLTNETAAAQEFYSVRSQHIPLTTQHPETVPGGQEGENSKDSGLPGGLIALGVVLGCVVVAAALFLVWFFWLRRKHGKDGIVLAHHQRSRSESNGGGDGGDGRGRALEMDPVERARRREKNRSMQRQKSMIDGYSDFDTDSLAEAVDTKQATDAADYPHHHQVGAAIVTEDDDQGRLVAMLSRDDSTFDPPSRRNRRSSSRKSSARISAWESSYPPNGWSSASQLASSPRQEVVPFARYHDRTASMGTNVSQDSTGFAAETGQHVAYRDDDVQEQDGESVHQHHRPPSITVPCRSKDRASISQLSALSPTREALLGGGGGGGGEDTGDRGHSGPLGMGVDYAQGSILGVINPLSEGGYDEFGQQRPRG